MNNSLLYIGAGTDTNPLCHFLDVKTFICIDTQPRSEFDSVDNYIHVYSHQDFVNKLILQYEKIGFKLRSEKMLDEEYYKRILNNDQVAIYESEINSFKFINPALLIFENLDSDQMVKYYISTNILSNMNTELVDDIKAISGLIVCGFYPDKSILDYIVKPISFYGYSGGNVFKYITEEWDQIELNSVMKLLQDNIKQKYFSDFYVVLQNTGAIIRKQKYSDFL